jgi:hypothetical protein
MIRLALDYHGSEVFSGTIVSTLFLLMRGRSGKALTNVLAEYVPKSP